VFGTYDAETRMTTFTFIMQSGGDVEITLDDVSNTIPGNGFELGKDKDRAENPWLN
jgi:hypothetical protein